MDNFNSASCIVFCLWLFLEYGGGGDTNEMRAHEMLEKNLDHDDHSQHQSLFFCLHHLFLIKFRFQVVSCPPSIVFELCNVPFY